MNIDFKKIVIYFVYTVAVLFVLLAIYSFAYIDKVLPGVYIGNHDFSGLSKSQALEKVNSIIPEDKQIEFVLEKNRYNAGFETVGVAYNTVETVDALYNAGRQDFLSPFSHILGHFKPVYEAKLKYEMQDELLNLYISNIAASNFPTSKNAYFYLENNELKIAEASRGEVVQLRELRQDVQVGLGKGKYTYTADVEEFVPSIYAEDLGVVKEDVDSFLNREVLFSYNDQVFIPSKEEKLYMISIDKDKDGKPVINSSNEGINSYITTLSSQIDVDPKSFKFEVQGDNVYFEPPITGLSIKKDEMVKLIKEEVLNFSNTTEVALEIPIEETRPDPDENKYGIKELVAEGVSYFKGSGSNRVSNIVTAGKKINGTLVAPGENFSFNEAVGPITIEAGFNQGYIISKGRTVLGTGGGVCQASTTVFRAVLNSGLPIVDRTAHAFRVSYYEQQSQLGLDATIYQPSVDLVFKNDMDTYILVYAEVDPEAYTMSVKIYGTKDGRNVEISDTEQITQLPPPEPVYLETEELPEGEIKQVEWPAWGGTVMFSRTVVDKNGEQLYYDEFKNYYQPWAAVYERGV